VTFECDWGCMPEDHGAVNDRGTWIVLCDKHHDVIEVNGQARTCISCDGGVF